MGQRGCPTGLRVIKYAAKLALPRSAPNKLLQVSPVFSCLFDAGTFKKYQLAKFIAICMHIRSVLKRPLQVQKRS